MWSLMATCISCIGTAAISCTKIATLHFGTSSDKAEFNDGKPTYHQRKQASASPLPCYPWQQMMHWIHNHGRTDWADIIAVNEIQHNIIMHEDPISIMLFWTN
jgi:hypothetical protein